MTVVEKLRRGLERVTKGWCQGSYARDLRGGSIISHWPEAVSWCARGALDGPLSIDVGENRYLTLALGDDRVTQWNDEPGRTQEEVVELFRKAIALAEKDEASAREIGR